MSTTLYAIAAQSDPSTFTPTLVTLDTATGQVTTVGKIALPVTGKQPTIDAAAAAANGLVYFVYQPDINKSGQELYTINLTTAAVSKVATLKPDGVDNLAAGTDGNLYADAEVDGGSDGNTNQLEVINPKTGVETDVGPGDDDKYAIGTDFTYDGTSGFYALAGVPSDLLDLYQPELMRVDQATGEPTVIGTFVGSADHIVLGDDGVLYGLDTADADLISIDPTTGKSAVVDPSVSNISGEYLDLIGAAPPATSGTTPTSTPTLTPTTGKSTVPTSIVAGTKAKGTVTVTVANGGTAIKGTDTVSLYAVTAGEAATAGTLLGTAKHGGTLAAGKSASVAVAVKPVALPAGNYTLLAVVTDPSGGTATAAAGPAVTVAPATVALSATMAASPAAVTPGKALSLTLTITNSGNVDSTGTATIAVYLSADGTALTYPVATVKAAPTVKPGKSATVHLKVKVPTSAAAMNLYPLAVFTQGTATPTTAVATSKVAIG